MNFISSRRVLKVGLVVLLSLAIGVPFGKLLNSMATKQPTTVEVEALISGGSRFNLYYNDTWSDPQHQPIVANTWHTYVFAVPAKLTSLRLDPSEAAGSLTQIRRISVSVGEGEGERLDLSSIPSWIAYHTQISYDPATKILSFKATGPNEYAMSTIQTKQHLSAHLSLTGWGLTPVSFLWACAIVAVPLYVLQSAESGWAMALYQVLLVVLAWFASKLSFVLASALHLSPPAPDDCVSLPLYMGISKSTDQVSVLAAAALTLIIIWAGSLLLSRGRHQSVFLFDHTATPSSEGWRIRTVLFFAGSLFTFAVLAFPNLGVILQSLGSVHHRFDHDTQMVVMWEYLARHGMLPFRDFWFPYAGMYDKLAPLHDDLLREYALNLLTFAVLFGSIYMIVGRRKLVTLLICLPFPLLEAIGLLWPNASWRYFLSLSVVLAGVAVLVLKRRWAFVAWGIWCTYVLSQEGSQPIYAAPAVLFLVGAAFWLARNRAERTDLLRSLSWSASAFGLATAFWVAMLVRQGQFREWWLFQSTLGIQSQYFSYPAPVASWFRVPTTMDQFGILLLLLLLALGSTHLLRRRCVNPVHLAPLAIGILTYMLTQKQIVRPPITTQYLAIPLLGLALIFIQNELSASDSAVSGLGAVRFGWTMFSLTTLLVCFVAVPGALRSTIAKYSTQVEQLSANVNNAIFKQSEWREAEKVYFSPASLTLDETRGDVLKQDFYRATGPRGGSVFALGNDAYWYLILNQPTPFYLNFFHQAPRYSQYNTIDWLKLHKPDFVLWNSAEQDFDGVPNIIRLPLLFAYVVQNYNPYKKVDNFQLLRRRTASELPALDYWASQLGTTVDLGHLPAHSRIHDLIRPVGDGTPVLEATIRNPAAGRSREIRIKLDRQVVLLRFNEEQAKTIYDVRLDHVSLVAAAVAAGIQPVLGSAGTPDCEVALRYGQLSRDVLW